MLESSLYVQPDEDLGETPFESPKQLEENISVSELADLDPGVLKSIENVYENSIKPG